MYFISYCRKDNTFAIRLAKDLRAQGIEVWIDQLDIADGENWDDAIERALNSCLKVVLVLSPDSVRSQNVKDEISYAIEKEKAVIPVMYRPCSIPYRWRRLQRIDAQHGYEDALKRIPHFVENATVETRRKLDWWILIASLCAFALIFETWIVPVQKWFPFASRHLSESHGKLDSSEEINHNTYQNNRRLLMIVATVLLFTTGIVVIKFHSGRSLRDLLLNLTMSCWFAGAFSIYSGILGILNLEGAVRDGLASTNLPVTVWPANLQAWSFLLSLSFGLRLLNCVFR